MNTILEEIGYEDWNRPSNIKAFTSKKKNPLQHIDLDLSRAPEGTPNCSVSSNGLYKALPLVDDSTFIKQVHGINIIQSPSKGFFPEADGAFTLQKDNPCVVLTADCLPLMFCDKHGKLAGILHCGWRGLTNGIIDSLHKHVGRSFKNLSFWLGPTLCINCFEVKKDFIDHLNLINVGYLKFLYASNDKYFFDIRSLCLELLGKQKASKVAVSKDCTFCMQDKYHSYRRNKTRSRHASIIWIS